MKYRITTDGEYIWLETKWMLWWCREEYELSSRHITFASETKAVEYATKKYGTSAKRVRKVRVV